MQAAVGPKAVVLIGLSEEDGAKVRSWFGDMAPEFRVWPAPRQTIETDVTLEGVLGRPVDPRYPWPVYPEGTPPLVIFSGMAGSDLVAVVQCWEQFTGLDLPAFASTCHANMRRSLRKLIPEIIRSRNSAQMAEENPDLIKLDLDGGSGPEPVTAMVGSPAGPAPITLKGKEDLQLLKEKLRSRKEFKDDGRHLMRNRVLKKEQAKEGAVHPLEQADARASPRPERRALDRPLQDDKKTSREEEKKKEKQLRALKRADDFKGFGPRPEV